MAVAMLRVVGERLLRAVVDFDLEAVRADRDAANARRVADQADDGLIAAEDRVGLDAVLAFEQFTQRVDLVARRAVFQNENHRVSFRMEVGWSFGRMPSGIHHSSFFFRRPSCFANGGRRLGSRPGAVPIRGFHLRGGPARKRRRPGRQRRKTTLPVRRRRTGRCRVA